MYSLSSANSYLQSLVQQANTIKQEELNRLKEQGQPRSVTKYNPITRANLANLNQARQQLSTRQIKGSYDNQTSSKFNYNDYYNQLKNQINSFNLNNNPIEADRNIATANVSSLMGNRYTTNPQETLLNYLKSKGYTATIKEPNRSSWGGSYFSNPINTNVLEVKDASGKTVPIPISYVTQPLQSMPSWSYDQKLDPTGEYKGLYDNFSANTNIIKEYSALNSEIARVQNSIQAKLDQYDPQTKSNLMSVADMKGIIYFKDVLESLSKKRDEWADKVNAKNRGFTYTFNGQSNSVQPKGYEWDWFNQMQKQIKDTLVQYENEFSNTINNSQKLLSAFEKTKQTASESVTNISNIGLQKILEESTKKKTTKESIDFARQLASKRAEKIASMTNEETTKKAAPVFRQRPA